MTELKNCPFCGGEAIRSFTHIDVINIWSVECPKCGAEIADDESQDAADTHWNTRADGWQDIADAPELERVRVAGWQPRSSTCQGYWWHHEDVIFDGKAVDHPEAILWMPIYVPTFPTPPGGDHA